MESAQAPLTSSSTDPGHSYPPRRAYARLSHEDLARLKPTQDPGIHPALRSSASAASLQPSLRQRTNPPKSTAIARASVVQRNSHLTEDDNRRDSGLAPSLSNMVYSSKARTSGGAGPSSTAQPIPSIVVHDEAATQEHATPERAKKFTTSQKTTEAPPSSTTAAQPFEGISTLIPTGQFDDPFGSPDLSFSKRGSILWSGDKANALFARSTSARNAVTTNDRAADVAVPTSGRAISADDNKVSERVRSMYEHGDETWSRPDDMLREPRQLSAGREAEQGAVTGLGNVGSTSSRGPSSSARSSPAREPSSTSLRRPKSFIMREPNELAGGMEDWKDVDIADLDRYGFIRPRNIGSRGSSKIASPVLPGSPTAEASRVSGLSPVVESPPRTRDGSGQSRPRSSKFFPPQSPVANGSPGRRPLSRASTVKRVSPSILSNRSRTSVLSSRANKGRRWADEAVDMMTLQPGGPALPAHTEDGDSQAKRALERKREAKWAAMAKPTRPATQQAAPRRTSLLLGGGSSYTFDTSSDKLISRTWKGVPDRWRATAWYAFLTSSAQRQQGQSFVPDARLVDDFHAYQEMGCADDLQIDTDVPRTIGGHIMFRRRYRGGQRLLFRVLRALSLHFPATGYVQGMAGIVATLLCYYEEERAFVMAVRLWQCRGLSYLYDQGFTGLMSVLGQFNREWLARLPVRKTLEELDIDSTSFGTKWYLTLYGYSMPFAAQLRVWDVFMLLGDNNHNNSDNTGGNNGAGEPANQNEENGASAGAATATAMAAPSSAPAANFDILHAVAAALLDGLQDVILDADFDNAMKALTQPVPVGREDVLMRVAQREYREKQKSGSGNRKKRRG